MKGRQQSVPAAAVWSIGAKFADQAIGIISISILARVLSPSDFGLVAMAGAIVALIEIFTSFGFDWALVRHQSPERDHYDTAWSLRILLFLCTFVLLCAAAIPASAALNVPELALIIVAMAANGLLSALENIGVVDFRRNMRFDLEFRFRMISRIAGFLAGVGFALATESYWALVVGVTVTRLTGVVSSYVMHPFRPRWSLAKRSDLLRFSAWMMAGNVIELARQRFADLWLGRLFGPRVVGLYSMAAQLSLLATSEIAAPINRVVFTKYTQAGGHIETLRHGFLRVSGLIWALGLPAAVGIGVCAPQIIAVLLGSQWTEAVVVLQILAVAGVTGVMAANTHYIYWALGQSRFVALLSTLALITFVVVALLLGRDYGVIGVATAQVIASMTALCVNYSALTKALQLPLADIAKRVYRIPLAGATMGVSVFFLIAQLSLHVTTSPIALLLVSAPAGAAVYAASLWMIWVLFGRPAGPEREAFQLILDGLSILVRRGRSSQH